METPEIPKKMVACLRCNTEYELYTNRSCSRCGCLHIKLGRLDMRKPFSVDQRRVEPK